MKYTESNTVINAELMMPRSEYDPETYFEFTIEGKNTHNKDLYYEILINHGEDHETRKTRLDDKFLRFRLEEIVGEDVTPVIEEGTYEEIDNTKIWVNTIKANTKTKTSIKYRLYMWITDEVNIGVLADADYSQEVWNNDVFASIKVSVNGDFEEKKVENTEPLLDTIKEAITTHTTSSCIPTITDDNDTPEDPSDDIIYFSGSKTCVNFNYVWYSGKLWRIVAINPDGSMKLITEDAITAINWGADTTYENSWIYQWLNEDFKDTLYNCENIIVQNADWYATKDVNTTPVRPSINDDGIVRGNVGLLNAYEYSQAYKNANKSTNYLNVGYAWWLITSKDGSNVRNVKSNGDFNYNSPGSIANGVRPSINLKSNIRIVSGGDGSEISPYHISGDKEPGSSGELINTRLSGEYVKVDNKIYRVVGIENGTTKLTSIDYVRDEGKVVLTKNFGRNENWTLSVSSGNEDYWGHYLNNIWLTSELKKYITEGTYYLGQYGYPGVSYKNTICNESNTTEPTSSCEKTSSTWTGQVGLPRVGEMFSAQLGSGSSSSSNIWLITPYISMYARFVHSDGNLYYATTSSNANTVRPSIYLKSEVIISSGSGTKEEPYEIALPE